MLPLLRAGALLLVLATTLAMAQSRPKVTAPGPTRGTTSSRSSWESGARRYSMAIPAVHKTATQTNAAIQIFTER